MVILDLAALCSPIHNFKRGFIFSRREDIEQNNNDSNNSSNNLNDHSNTRSKYTIRSNESLLYNKGGDNSCVPRKHVSYFETGSQNGNKLSITGNAAGLFGANYSRGVASGVESTASRPEAVGVSGTTVVGSSVGNSLGNHKLGTRMGMKESINKHKANEGGLNELGNFKNQITDFGRLNVGVSGTSECLNGTNPVKNLNSYICDGKYVCDKYSDSNGESKTAINGDSEPKEEYSSDDTVNNLSSTFLRTKGIKNYSYCYENPVLGILYNSAVNNNGGNTVVIFDLDDTLIPTEWIRDTYSKIRQNISLNYLFSNSNNDVYQYIRMQIDQQVGYLLIPSVITMLTFTKKQFLDVAIVTNARSVGWLKVIEAMFPELMATLGELGIPIIRTNPQGIEPEIEEGERYFNYWMMAKKNEFEKIVNRWISCRNGNSNSLDISDRCFSERINLISIGDNDFEEFAAVHLAVIDKKVGFSKIIRCTPGLSPKMFLTQLQTIFNVIGIESKKNISHSWISYTNTVSARIIENGQLLPPGCGLYEDSTEDE